MLALAAAGTAHEGDWLIADTQTGGRGRQGRAWQSPLGNFYGSTLAIVRPGDPPIGGLSLAAGLGLITAVGDPAMLKWPNDLMIRGAKVAGILLERSNDAVVIGFGINLVSAPVIAGRKTTSLLADGSQTLTRDAMLDRLAERVGWAIAFWRTHGNAAVARRWQDEAHPIGIALSVELPDRNRLDGRFDGLTDDCALRLRLADGTVHVIHAGDVFLI